MVRGPIRIQYWKLPSPHTNVAITHAMDARNVYIRPIDSVSNNEYLANVKAIERYAAIANFLHETPLVGQVILAKNKETFQRAMVLKEVGADRFAVSYIEYGNLGFVSMADCKELSGNLQVLKRYVHKCTLNISPEINNKHEDAIKLLNKMLNVNMKIVCNSPVANGTLVNLIQVTNGQSLKDQINSFVE